MRRFAARNTESAGQLLAAFFRYYGCEFDYVNDAVSIRAGGPVSKLVKAEDDCWTAHSRLSIEDPFETWYDVAHPVKLTRHEWIRMEYLRAYTMLTEVGGEGQAEDLLDRICEEAPPPVFLVALRTPKAGPEPTPGKMEMVPPLAL